MMMTWKIVKGPFYNIHTTRIIMKTLKCRSITCLITAVTISIPLTTLAQLEEIVVTAQKREENIQDVPIAITGFSETKLAEGRIQTTQDLQSSIPSLNYGILGPYSEIYLRGVGANPGIQSADPAVASYQDGIYFPGQAGAMQTLLGTERVEVLAGPQGTLYGRNTTGGAINTYTLTPTQELEGTIKVTAGDFDRREFSGYLSGGVTDTLAVGVYAVYLERDSYLDIVQIPIPFPAWQKDAKRMPENESSEGIRLKAAWDATDKLTVTASIERLEAESADVGNYRNLQDNAIGYGFEPYQTINGAGSVFSIPGALGPLDVEAIPEFIAGSQRLTPGVIDEYYVETNLGYIYSEQTVGILRLNYELENGMQFTSLSGYVDHEESVWSDVDATAAPLFNSTGRDGGLTDKTLSQELQLKAPAGDNYQWIVGVYYMTQESAFEPNDSSGLLLDLFNPNALDAINENYGEADIESVAVFGQTTVPLDQLIDGLGLTLGLRWTRDTNEYINARRLQVLPGSTMVTGVFPEDKSNWTELTPKVTLDYQMENSLVYFTYSEGYRAGLYNVSAPDQATTAPVESEYLTAYEVGFKSDLFDDRLRFNAAGWYYDYEDIQVNRAVEIGPDGTAFAAALQNAAEAEIFGVEMTAIWVPLDNLNLTAGMTYLDAEYTDFKDASAVNLVGAQAVPFFTPNSSVTVDATGKKLIRSPEFVFNAGIDYRVPSPIMGGGELQFNLAGYYNDGYFFDTPNVLKQPSYHLIDAFIRWTSEDDKIGFKLWGKNLTDEFYHNRIINLVNVASIDGVPRHFGVTFDYKFF